MTPKITHRTMTPAELLSTSNYAVASYDGIELRSLYLFDNAEPAEKTAEDFVADEWRMGLSCEVVTLTHSDAADLDSIVDRAYIDHIGNGGIVDEDPRDEELREYREFVDALNGWISRGMCDADEGGIYNEGTEMLQQVYGFLNGYAAASHHIDL